MKIATFLNDHQMDRYEVTEYSILPVVPGELRRKKRIKNTRINNVSERVAWSIG